MIKKPALPRIAILGWGSLIWDERSDFDDWHDKWEDDRPILSRKHALTLVIDGENGVPCRAQFAFSKRRSPEDAYEKMMLRPASR